MDVDSFLNGNTEQINAVMQDGNVFVVGNPGSGKTKMLVAKIGYLIDNLKINPKDILCLTFTTKAKEELKERIVKNLRDYNLSDLKIDTFHSFANEQIENYLIHKGRKKELINESFQRYLLLKILKKYFDFNISYLSSY